MPEGLAEIHKVSGKCQLLSRRFRALELKFLAGGKDSSGINGIPDEHYFPQG
jgi:hypothetical protein